MTGGIHPIDFEIDLRGVLELKIEFDGALVMIVIVEPIL